MLIRKTAVNYAKALFAVPGTQEEIQKRQADLEHLVDVIRQEPSVLQMLSYPDLPIQERLNQVEALLKRKANHLTVIASEYHKLVVDDLKSLDVDVESLEPLSEDTRKKLLAKLESTFKKKINLIETINPELISGFVLQIGNKLLDLSIQSKLTKFKKLILKGEA